MYPKPSAGEARTESDAPPTEKRPAVAVGETHVPAEDAVVVADGGGAPRLPEFGDLERDILIVLARSEPSHGSGLLDDLRTLRAEDVTGPLFYTRLNDLVDDGLVSKREHVVDNRSHQYRLSSAGRAAVQQHAARVANAAGHLTEVSE